MRTSRRTEHELKRIILAAAGAAAAAGLTACGHSAAPVGSSGAAPGSHKSATVRVPVSCGEQYHAWTHGHGKGLVTSVDAVSSAATAGDPQVLRAALKKARPAVSRAARHPMPGCADPRGYWYALLMHVNAAAAKGGSASTVRAALHGVPQVQHQLTTELKQTTQ
jgi:hypothetical protein